MKERFPYRPQLDMQQIRAFDEHLRNIQGSWTTIGRSFTNASAPGVIRLQWCIPDECWCDEHSFLDFLDRYTFRLLLRCFLRHTPMTRNERKLVTERLGSEAEMTSWDCKLIWKTEQLFQKTGLGMPQEAFLRGLHFLQIQNFITAHRQDEWVIGSALEGIENFGPTFEWIVQAHLQHQYHAITRRCVSFREWQQAHLNDLDVVAFTQTQLITVECKSSHDFTEEQLFRFVRRAQAFPADIALLLIDTTSAHQVTKRLQQIALYLGKDAATDPGSYYEYKGSLIAHAIGNMGYSGIHVE